MIVLLRRDNAVEGQSEALTVTGAGDVVEGPTKVLTAAEVEEVGNLVADDEWLGLGMELAIVLRSAVRESLKSSTREFIGKDEYQVADLRSICDRIRSLHSPL